VLDGNKSYKSSTILKIRSEFSLRGAEFWPCLDCINLVIMII